VTVRTLLSELRIAPVSVLAVAAMYTIGLLAILMESAWIARDRLVRGSLLRSLATGMTMMIGALIVGTGVNWVFDVVSDALTIIRPAQLDAYWQEHRVLEAVACFVAWDALGWLYHWIGHRTRIGWAAHRPHHTGTHFNLTIGLRQSWLPIHAVVCFPLITLGGFNPETVVICAAVSNLWQLLEHLSIEIKWPSWLAAMVMTPDSHRLHHARQFGKHETLVNLGPVFTVWDRLAGTWMWPEVRPSVYGVDDSTANPFSIELAGWNLLLRRTNEQVTPTVES
jgi:alkylglycerol monooxygenase